MNTNQNAVLETVNNEAPETETPKIEPNEVEQAQAAFDSLKRKISAGENVTPRQFSEAKNAVEFAELRESARAERQQKQLEIERRERLAVLQRQLSSIPKVESFEKHLTAIEKPLEKYLSEIAKRNDEISEIDSALHQGAFLPGHINFAPVDGVVVEARSSTSPLRIGDAEAESLDPRAKVERFIADILQKHFPARGR